MMAGPKRTSRLAAPDIRGQDISQDLCVYRGISRHRYMPKFGVALEIDVFQQSAKMLALLHRFSDPVREIEIFQPMDIGGNGILVTGSNVTIKATCIPASLRVSAMPSAALAPKECPTSTIEVIRPLLQSCSASLARSAANA
jgi:hypothetical protein